MDHLDQSIIQSMDGSNPDLIPYLPYLLQDVWEIGSSPSVILGLIKKNGPGNAEHPLKIADLGCGKGAVSIALARQLSCNITGIDAIPQFIDAARYYANRYDVQSRCHFEVGDIRKKVHRLSGFDYVILGSIGPVLGSPEQTLYLVQKCLNAEGMIVWDDAYLKDPAAEGSGLYQNLLDILRQIEKCELKIVDQYIYSQDEMERMNASIYSFIKKRTGELIEKFPERESLFQEYLESQIRENDILENEVECVTWILQKKR